MRFCVFHNKHHTNNIFLLHNKCSIHILPFLPSYNIVAWNRRSIRIICYFYNVHYCVFTKYLNCIPAFELFLADNITSSEAILRLVRTFSIMWNNMFFNVLENRPLINRCSYFIQVTEMASTWVNIKPIFHSKFIQIRICYDNTEKFQLDMLSLQTLL